MQRQLAILSLAAFIALAVFGFFAMGHAEGTHGACLGAIAQSALCPNGSPLAWAAFHLNAFRIFTTANLINLAILIMLAAFAWSVLWTRQFFDQLELSRAYVRQVPDRRLAAQYSWLSWLALLERRDPATAR